MWKWANLPCIRFSVIVSCRKCWQPNQEIGARRKRDFACSLIFLNTISHVILALSFPFLISYQVKLPDIITANDDLQIAIVEQFLKKFLTPTRAVPLSTFQFLFINLVKKGKSDISNRNSITVWYVFFADWRCLVGLSARLHSMILFLPFSNPIVYFPVQINFIKTLRLGKFIQAQVHTSAWRFELNSYVQFFWILLFLEFVLEESKKIKES